MPPNLTPCAFLAAEGVLGTLGDQPALLLGERCVDVQHERIGVGAELGDDERRPVRHQPGDEMHVAGQPIELGDDDRRTLSLRAYERPRAPCPAPALVIIPLPAFGLGERGADGEALGLGEGLAELPRTKLDRLPRMADFALWATACETALWPAGTFWSAYCGNRDEAVEGVIDADPIAATCAP